MDMKLTIDGLEKERDFYFGKLRDIELICQESENENSSTLGKILDVLYATEVNAVLHTLIHLTVYSPICLYYFIISKICFLLKPNVHIYG